MIITRKPVIIGPSTVIVTTIAALSALGAWTPIAGGPRSSAGLTWNVEYWHRNADGQVSQHQKEHNAVVASGLEHAMKRLIAAGDALVLYGSRFDSTGGTNRSEIQTQLRLAGADLPIGWSQGYIRRNSGPLFDIDVNSPAVAPIQRRI